MSPVRVQRKRTKGWRAPMCSCGCGKPARYVGRGTRFGNSFQVVKVGYLWGVLDGGVSCSAHPTRGAAVIDAVERYRRLLDRHPVPLGALTGHDLMCWCPLEDAAGDRVPCHADVLLCVANRWDRS